MMTGGTYEAVPLTVAEEVSDAIEPAVVPAASLCSA